MSSELPSWAAGYQDSKIFEGAHKAEPQPARATRQPSAAARAPHAGPQAGGFTINDPNARIEGRFETTETIEIGCEVTGEITAGRLVIAESGNVSAAVRAGDVVIEGAFEGDIVASGTVELHSTGRLRGKVTTDSLIIARGALFSGSIERLEEAGVPALQPSQVPELVSEQAEDDFDGTADRRADGQLIAIELSPENALPSAHPRGVA